MGHGCCESGYSGSRSFLTKEEKIEMLKEYKQALEKEIQGIKENIERMEKNN